MGDEAPPIAPMPDGDGVLVRLKVVPGASRSELAGLHGGRYRVRVSAPPEGGKANRAVCVLLAEHLGLPRRAVTIAKGAGSPRKTVAVAGISPTEAARRLA